MISHFFDDNLLLCYKQALKVRSTTEAFFEAYLLNAVPAELWPELDVEQTKRRLFLHLR